LKEREIFLEKLLTAHHDLIIVDFISMLMIPRTITPNNF